MYSQNNKTAPFIRLVIGLGLLLILLVVLFSVVRQAISPPHGALATPVIWFTSTQSPFPFEQERETVEAAVMQTHWALIETWTPQSPTPGRPPTHTPAPFVPGIYEISYATVCYPPGRVNCIVTTVWKNIISNERTLVYAGARIDYSNATPVESKGLVIVKVYSKDLSNRNTIEYETDVKTGQLKIIAATGYRLTLLAQNGATLYFDVPSRQFVNGLTVEISAPTITPLPPITPTNALLIPQGYPAPVWTPAYLGYPPPSTSAPVPTSQP